MADIETRETGIMLTVIKMWPLIVALVVIGVMWGRMEYHLYEIERREAVLEGKVDALSVEVGTIKGWLHAQPNGYDLETRGIIAP